MTPHDLIAAFETLSEAPSGVKRLRELVLQLAVRGRLVPQDPADEPATVLLERIAAQKTRLAEQGKIRKSDALPPLSGDEVPFPVPQVWAWARLAWLGSTQTGATPKKEDLGGGGPRIPFVRPNDIHWKGVDCSREVVPRTAAEATGRIVRAGAILMVCIGTVGKTALCQSEATFNQQINSIQPVLALPTFVAWAVRSPTFQSMCQVAASATTISILNKSRWEALPVPVPPLAEQHRIVARVDELMALLDRLEAARNARDATRGALRDAALAALRNADTPDEVEVAWQRIAEGMDDLFTDPADVNPLRQAVLQLAVRGKLVLQDPADEPASALLQRIAWEKDRLVKAGKIRKSDALPQASANEIPFDIPEGWSWSCLAGLCLQIHYGYTASADPSRLDNRLLRITDIQNNRVDWGTVPGCEITPEDLKKYALSDGDILVARTGGTVGKTYQVRELGDLDAVFASYLIRVVPSGHTEIRFVKVAMETPLYWRQLIDRTAGTGQPNVNATSLSSLLLPLPPLAEQCRIVAKVDELMTLLDRLEERLKAQRDLQDAFAAAAVHHLDA